MLLENRHESVKEGDSAFAERIAWKMWKQAMLHRGYMNMGSSKMKNWVLNKFLTDWKRHRGDIEFPRKSFNQIWKEKYGVVESTPPLFSSATNYYLCRTRWNIIIVSVNYTEDILTCRNRNFGPRIIRPGARVYRNGVTSQGANSSC
jgi:hypothetical protein